MILLKPVALFLPLALLSFAPVHAQTSASIPASTPAAQATPAPPPVAFQARANLVLVDVVVTNNGAAVNGLTKDKFHIFENGEAQQVTVFEEHTPDTAPAVAKAPNFGPNVYSDFPEYAVSSAANVLLLDGLNTPVADQVYARQQMIKYLKNIPPGTRIAVFTLASQLRMVEGFTTDSNTIARALSGKGGPQQSVILDPQTDQQISDSMNEMASLGASQLAQSSMQQFQADLASFQTDVRVQMTLDAMKNLARYLSAIPGRKNLIWFSGSFPLSIDPDSTLQSPFEAMRTYSADVRQTDDMLSAARVAVYPVDARGLMSLPSVSAANNYASSPAGVAGSMSGGGRGSSGKGSGPRTIGGGGGSSQPAAAKADQKFMHSTIVEHQTMQQIAEDTGGEAFIDTNGLKEAVAQAIANGSHYYTVGYVPKPKKYDGSFYRIRLNLDGGYQAAYRRGYYADDLSSKAAIASPDSPAAPQNVMLEAIERGAPPISEIPFKVRVLAADDPSARGVKLAPGPAGATAKDLKGTVKRYLVDYAVDARPFAFTTTPDGVRHAQFEVAVVAYNADGKRLNYADRGNQLTLTPTLYEQVIHAGVPLHQEIDLPAGQVYLRVVVHDLGNARIGSTEIPLVVAK